MKTSVNISLLKRWPIRLVSLLVVLAVLAAALPQPALAVTCVAKYTVTAGDTLTIIADQYKITVLELANANSMKEPYTIYVGQSLCIPVGATTTTTSSSSSSTESTTSVELNGRKLTIKLAGLSKSKVFYLRIRSASHSSRPWYKLGTVKASKTGSAAKVIALPRALRNTEVITLCWKNAFTDSVKCQNFTINE